MTLTGAKFRSHRPDSHLIKARDLYPVRRSPSFIEDAGRWSQ